MFLWPYLATAILRLRAILVIMTMQLHTNTHSHRHAFTHKAWSLQQAVWKRKKRPPLNINLRHSCPETVQDALGLPRACQALLISASRPPLILCEWVPRGLLLHRNSILSLIELSVRSAWQPAPLITDNSIPHRDRGRSSGAVPFCALAMKVGGVLGNRGDVPCPPPPS